MKILLVETELSGHHTAYMKALFQLVGRDCEIYSIIPETNSDCQINGKCILFNNSSVGYVNWLIRVWRYVNEIRPDVIHFLYGDDLYRFFGLGLGFLFKKRTKIIITCHQIRRSFLRDLSFKMISRKCDNVVVHTDSLLKDFRKLGISNVVHIEYPQFSNSEYIESHNALSKLNIKDCNKPVLLALGGTRKDKGLDILLKSLKKVNVPFHLIIAGNEEFFKREYIKHEIESYKDKITLFLEYLSDEKFTLCLNAADVIVLPYRKSFNGASGPLGEGVSLGKMIIGANHGSLGEIIYNNHLGYTFESEDVDSLSELLNNVLCIEWKPDNKYLEYQKLLSTQRFQEDYYKLYIGC